MTEHFREEMRWLYGQNAICEDHNQEIEIEDMGSGYVKFTCKVERHIRNISGKKIEINLGLGTDEWFVPQNSEISEFGYRMESGKRVDIPTDKLERRKQEKGRPIIHTEPQKERLPKNEKVIVWMKFTEFKPINSDDHIHFSYATVSPRVSIKTPNSIGAVAAFPRETETNKPTLSSDTYLFDGLVLPGQEIRFDGGKQKN